MSELMLDVDQAGELKAAFRRGDWTNAEIKKLCEGEMLALVREFVLDRAEIVVKKNEVPLLILVNGQIKLAGNNAPFSAAETFTKKNAGVRFHTFGGNFTSWFGAKEEGSLAPTILRVHKLLQNSGDTNIIRELGGKEKAETTLAEVYALIKKQARGENGVLLTSGMANIFYIRDVSGIFRAVFICWYGGGWDAYARSLHEDVWIEGNQVFSRNYAKVA